MVGACIKDLMPSEGRMKVEGSGGVSCSSAELGRSAQRVPVVWPEPYDYPQRTHGRIVDWYYDGSLLVLSDWYRAFREADGQGLRREADIGMESQYASPNSRMLNFHNTKTSQITMQKNDSKASKSTQAVAHVMKEQEN
ncbi:hypothetical protein E6O75_ATG00360 [Venturia nashicola]|uniref:Uncharacterized protein n=1 Tax=Venturia nashicola TaxID=86259 RepID=A0A4Z1PF53_9PEZI|nr:hypothetical protein E6O75_ATG00360 [Venturia nashicola]